MTQVTRSLLLLALVGTSALVLAKPKVYPLDFKMPEHRASYYSQRLHRLLASWPPKYVPAKHEGENPIWMRPIRTKGKPNYFGIVKRVSIQAPLAQIAATIENFEASPDLFTDVIQVRKTMEDGNFVTTYWEREPPVFLAPRIRYQQSYLIDKSNPVRLAYRYQLKTSDSVSFSDGLIVIEKEGENGTRLIAWDFFETDFGLLKTLAENAIWRRALEGSYKGDVTFKAHAEHPDWNRKQLQAEAERMLERFPVEPFTFLEEFEIGE